LAQIPLDAGKLHQWQIDEALVESLIDEAAQSNFTRIVGTKFGAKVSPRRITSPLDLASAEAGEAAAHLSSSAEARAALSMLSSEELALTATTYVLYDRGSFIGLHTDRSGCDLTLLTALVGAPTTFEYFPTLVDEPAPTVYEVAKGYAGLIDGGETIELSVPGASVAFIGSVLPHQRRHAAEPVLMVSLCYHFVWTHIHDEPCALR
jgi:hypothetical protein